MICSSCLTEASEGAKFCRECGLGLAQAAVPSTDEAAHKSTYAKLSEKAAEKGRKAMQTDIGQSVSGVATEAVQVTKDALKTRIGKSVVAHAALGAAIAVPIPLIGTLTGAFIGGAIGAVRAVMKD